MKWRGVMPALTTPFDHQLHVDHEFMAKHGLWTIEAGCTGIVLLGSLGEGATLTFEEKLQILARMHAAVKNRAPIVAAISALSTAEAVALAKEAYKLGCEGLMILPPYVYQGDWREMKEHVGAVLSATPLSCMLYNNPVAYGTDFKPENIKELADVHGNLHAVKESSADVRRVSAIRAVTNDQMAVFVGVDDAIVEALGVGATGWIAGLVNAFPRESVTLFDHASSGKQQEAFGLYRWFLPLLRMDTVPKFVQLIKLAQQKVDMGNTRVRPPRLELIGAEFEEASAVIDNALEHRPEL
jgi:1-pyrroline-4-hydroxy-2-carboxylate deaminase